MQFKAGSSLWPLSPAAMLQVYQTHPGPTSAQILALASSQTGVVPSNGKQGKSKMVADSWDRLMLESWSKQKHSSTSWKTSEPLSPHFPRTVRWPLSTKGGLSQTPGHGAVRALTTGRAALRQSKNKGKRTQVTFNPGNSICLWVTRILHRMQPVVYVRAVTAFSHVSSGSNSYRCACFLSSSPCRLLAATGRMWSSHPRKLVHTTVSHPFHCLDEKMTFAFPFQRAGTQKRTNWKFICPPLPPEHAMWYFGYLETWEVFSLVIQKTQYSKLLQAGLPIQKTSSWRSLSSLVNTRE